MKLVFVLTSLMLAASSVSACKTTDTSGSQVKSDDNLDSTSIFVGKLRLPKANEADDRSGYTQYMLDSTVVNLADAKLYLATDKQFLKQQVDSLLASGEVVEIQTVFETFAQSAGSTVLAARPYVESPNTPTFDQVSHLADAFFNSYSLNSAGVTRCQSEWCLSVGFVKHTDLDAFTAKRLSEGKSSKVEILTIGSKKIEVQLKKMVTGPITASSSN